MTRKRRRPQPPPEVVEALADVVQGRALLIPDPAPSDLYGQYQWVQAMKALSPATTTPQKDEQMPTQEDTTSAAVRRLSETLEFFMTRVNEEMKQLTDRFTKLERRMAVIIDSHDPETGEPVALREELAALRATLNGHAPDALNDKIVAFLAEHAGVKFSAVSVAENIGGDPGRVSERLRTLQRKDRVRVLDRPNRHPLYFVEVA